MLYPLAKRVTWLCHLALGLTIGLAPVGAWLAVTGGLTWAPVMLGLAVAVWIAGFDVIYALLDVDFDRANGIHSIPARFGEARALWFTRGLHVAAVLLLVGTGLATDAGPIYMAGVAVCAAVLLYENAIVRPGDVGRIQAAFGQSNGLLAVRLPAVHPGRGDAVDPDVLVRGRGLVKAFGDRRAVDRVDVDLAAGECLAVLGPNGAGKSTLLRMLATLLRPEAGELSVCGAPLPDRAIRARAEIGYLGHDPLVYLDLTARQNLELYADLYGLEDAPARITEGLDRVGLLARSFDPVRTFSRGMAQRLGLARALLHRPRLLLLDEPYAGLDAAGARLLDGVIGDLGATRGAVMITHEVERGVAMAGRVLVLRAGRPVLSEGTAALGDGFRRALRGAGRVSAARPAAGRQLRALLLKDLRLELRSRDTLVAMLLFAVVAMLIFQFAFGARGDDLTAVSGGIMWATLALTAVLGVGRSWVPEREQRVLDGILSAPIPRLVLLVAKAGAIYAYLFAVEVVVVPLTVLFFIRHPEPVDVRPHPGRLPARQPRDRDPRLPPRVPRPLRPGARAAPADPLPAVPAAGRDRRVGGDPRGVSGDERPRGIPGLLPVSGGLCGNLRACGLRDVRARLR